MTPRQALDAIEDQIRHERRLGNTSVTIDRLRVILDRVQPGPAEPEPDDDEWSRVDPGFALTHALDVANGKLAHLRSLCEEAFADGTNALLALQVVAIIDDPEG